MGENLQTYCIKNGLEHLLKEWHPVKNGDLRPTDVTAGSGKKVYWILPYDDPTTGKHFEFEWKAMIACRVKGIGCPYLTGQAVWFGFNDLLTTHPKIAKQWHPTKNGNLKPADVTAGSSKKVYWLLPYDDPTTGKHFNFVWESRIQDMVKSGGCPYLSGKAVWKGFNDLETIYPELVKEWHPAKNGNLKPSDVTVSSHHKVWWYLPYDDMETGKHFDFEWKARVADRIKGIGCPYLSGKAVWKGFNDLLTTYPKIAKQWHPTKNGNLKPTDVTAGSSKKVYWLLPYDDPTTGKHFDFEWIATVNARTKGNGCPYLSGKAVWSGFNDLETICPELAAEWHPSMNKLKPSEITVGSEKSVWWKCPMGHSYKSVVWFRTLIWCNCSICNKETKTSFPEQVIYYYIKQVFHDAVSGDIKTLDSKKELDIYIPSIHIAIEYDGKKWHENVKKDIIKNYECANKKLILIRIREEGCPEMEENKYLKIIKCNPNDIKSLEDAIQSLGKYLNVMFNADIEKDRIKIYNQYITSIKKNSLAVRVPELAKEWNYKRNGKLTPEMVNYTSPKKVWWHLSYDDLDTGKHFDFEWKANIYSRVLGSGCPYLVGHAVYQGFNDLSTTHPELAKQWHPTKNGDLKPVDVTAGCNKKVWWHLPYNDPKTGKHFEFEWKAMIGCRVKGSGCPYLSGKAVWKGFNDLSTTHPELAKQWHPTKNGDLKPADVTAGSGKKVYWLLPYDDPKTGKHFDFEWEATIYSRSEGNGCPFLSGKAVWLGFNDLTTTHPYIAKEWHSIRNEKLKPAEVTSGSKKEVWWINRRGKVWKAKICDRTKNVANN